MRNLLAGLIALLSLLATTVSAQPLYPGRAMPLTDTRYGTIAAHGVLTNNGRDAFLVWAAAENVRVARVVQGERRVGRPIFDLDGITHLDVAWTGSHFVVIAQQLAGNIHARLLSAAGEPIGEPLVIGAGFHAQVASNGREVALLYKTQNNQSDELHVRRFTTMLQPLDGGVPSAILSSSGSGHWPVELDLASNGSGYAVVSMALDETRVILLNATAAFVTSEAFRQGENATPGELRGVAIAANGNDYLAVWTMHDAVWSAAISRTGRITPLAVHRTDTGWMAGAPSVTWNGTRFEVTFVERNDWSARLRTAIVDAATPAVQSLDAGVASDRELPVTSTTAIGERVLTVWRDADDYFVVRHGATANRIAVTFGAADQELRAATSSNAGTLAVWSETYDGATTLRAGVRRYSGEWTEFRVSNRDAETALAASDGEEYVVVTYEFASGWTATYLDDEGRVRARSTAVPARAIHDLVRAGSGYALLYTDAHGNGVLALLSNNGSIAASRTVWVAREDHTLQNMSLDWDGLNFVVAWESSQFVMCFPVCDMAEETVELARFNNELQRLGDNVRLGGNDAQRPTVTWDGRQHVIVWNQAQELRAMTLAVDGTAGPVTPIASGTTINRSSSDREAVRIGNRVAVYWQQTPFDGNTPPTFLLNGSQRTELLEVAFDTRAMVALPNGAAAYIGTDEQMEAPHHGARRLLLRRFDVTPPGNVPDAPVTRVHRELGQLRIEWTPPPQPVIGYRVEYRVSDGSWNELGQWFDAHETQAFWTAPLQPGVTYAFRVRAFSDNGTSAYSNAPVIFTAKRRAVR